MAPIPDTVPKGFTIKGKASWFGGPTDKMGATTLSDPRVQGIAVYNTATKGGWWLVQLGDQKFVVQQTDVGPAPWTGKVVDFGANTLKALGSDPTGKDVTAVYLGDTIPSDLTDLGVQVIGKNTTGTASAKTGAPVKGATSQVVNAVTAPVTDVATFLSNLWGGLTNPKTWLRIAMGIGALFLLMFGLFELAGHGSTVTNAPKKAVAV